MTQARDERLGAPFAERSTRLEPLAPSGAPALTGHLGVYRGLVDEHQSVRFAAHRGLPLVDPDPAAFSHVGACALRRHQLFFYM